MTCTSLKSKTVKIYFAIETIDTSINPFDVHHKLPVYPVKRLILAIIATLIYGTTV